MMKGLVFTCLKVTGIQLAESVVEPGLNDIDEAMKS